jgi:hypothetical protein
MVVVPASPKTSMGVTGVWDDLQNPICRSLMPL